MNDQTNIWPGHTRAIDDLGNRWQGRRWLGQLNYQANSWTRTTDVQANRWLSQSAVRVNQCYESCSQRTRIFARKKNVKYQAQTKIILIFGGTLLVSYPYRLGLCKHLATNISCSGPFKFWKNVALCYVAIKMQVQSLQITCLFWTRKSCR